MERFVTLRFDNLNIESVPLRIERSPLGWFGHVSRIPLGRLSNKVNGNGLVEGPLLRWIDYIEVLVGTVWNVVCELRSGGLT